MQELPIGFIAPMEQLYSVVTGVIAEMGIGDKIEVHRANLKDAVGVAFDMERRNFSCIVSRGGTAEMLNSCGTILPVITIPLTSYELSHAIFEAKRITGLKRPRIAMLTFRNMEENIDLFAKVLGVEMHLYKIVGNEANIADTLETAVKDGLDVVVGGEWTSRISKERGIPTVKLFSNPASVRGALEEAIKVRYSIQLEHRRSASLRMLVNSIKDGLLHVDSQGVICHANAAAADMMGLETSDLVGKSFYEYFPQFRQMEGCVEQGSEEVITFGSTTALVTLSPMPETIDSSAPSFMVVMHETNRVLQMDARLRKMQTAKGLNAIHRFNDIAGHSPVLREAKRLATSFAASDATVLIYGESGTGKELFAQSIHNASPWANGPFVAVNCAALPPSLLESELFGYEEGAFTGANRKGKVGLIEMAHNGTLFLDEISEMDHYGQVRLLRFLQERSIMRLGGDKYLPVKVRIIAATNRDLGAMVAEGSFRRDLYYRLRVLRLRLPPLRARKGDVRLLTEDLLRALAVRHGYEKRCTIEAYEVLEEHPWPGNVRELNNVLECLMVGQRGKTITAPMLRQVFALDDTGDAASGRGCALAWPGGAPVVPPAHGAPLGGWPAHNSSPAPSQDVFAAAPLGRADNAWPYAEHAGQALPTDSQRRGYAAQAAGVQPSAYGSQQQPPSKGSGQHSRVPFVDDSPPIDEREQILSALYRCGGRHGRAAAMLGLHRSTLYRKMRRLNIE